MITSKAHAKAIKNRSETPTSFLNIAWRTPVQRRLLSQSRGIKGLLKLNGQPELDKYTDAGRARRQACEGCYDA